MRCLLDYSSLNHSDHKSTETLVGALENLTGHCFVNKTLALEALTHSSYSNESSLSESESAAVETQANVLPKSAPEGRSSDNERLEFLGDAVIGLVVAENLMRLFPEACEGMLSRWRSGLVSRKTLAEIAVQMDLGRLVLLGRGEIQTGGMEKRSILAAVLEAVVGAVFRDGGLRPANDFLMRIYGPFFELLANGDEKMFRLMDKKTHLQEKTQSLYKSAPLYQLLEVWGLEHEKFFRVQLLIEGKVIAHGDGRSKKDAEQQAASLALEILGF